MKVIVTLHYLQGAAAGMGWYLIGRGFAVFRGPFETSSEAKDYAKDRDWEVEG